ncbi:MAG TPA: ABC transporter permease [Candidatus Pullichristensenella excrementipullorum]|nr:ABC transporter permease [Candidatus Pullichristensenella excrementipullorum]
MKRYKDHKTEQLASALEEQLKEQLAQKEAQVAGTPSAEAAATGLSDEELFSFAGFDASEAERGGYSNYSYWRATLRVFFKNRIAVFFLIVMVLTLLFTFIQPLLPNQRDPLTIHYNETGRTLSNLLPGQEGFIFGTNNIGQDIWARIWSGTRTSLFIGFTVACVEAVLGILMGVLWGYVRKLDFFFTELYNVCDNIPQTLLLILISYILNPGVDTIIFALCLTGWLSMARFIRNQIIIIRDRDYNLASRCLGTPTMRIVFKNLLPYLVSVITMRMALSIPSAIGNEVFVTYIGIGLPLDTPSLGNLIEAGRELMTIPFLRYQLYFPVAVLALITISFYVIGNAFADAADPKNHVK